MITSSNGNIFRVTGRLCGEVQRSPVNSPHKGQWRGARMFSLICACINGTSTLMVQPSRLGKGYVIWPHILQNVWLFLTRPAVNIAVNKIDISRVRYHLSCVRVTIVWSLWRHRRSFVTSSAECNASEWDTGIMCEDPRLSIRYVV